MQENYENCIINKCSFTKKNISKKEFLKFKSDWLIKNLDLDLIEEYIVKIKFLMIIQD